MNISLHSPYSIPSDSKCPECGCSGFMDYLGDGSIACNGCERSWKASTQELAEIINGMSYEDRQRVLDEIDGKD